jgi:hypothetical protein
LLVQGMEPVAFCRDEEEAQKALASGAQVVAFDSKTLGVDQAIALAHWYEHPARHALLGRRLVLERARERERKRDRERD